MLYDIYTKETEMCTLSIYVVDNFIFSSDFVGKG